MKHLKPEQVHERGSCQLPYVLLAELPQDEAFALQGWLLDQGKELPVLSNAPEGAIYPWVYEEWKEGANG